MEQHSVSVPYPYPTSTFFLDESGTKAKNTFVVAGLKVRQHGLLARQIRDLRDKHGLVRELKFSGITRDSVDLYYELVDLVEASDAHMVGCVVAPDGDDPFDGHVHRWQGHADAVTRLLIGCMNRRELASLCIDGISTPRGCALDDTIKQQVNAALASTSLVSAVCLDSKTNDLLQVADMIASAIAFERRRLSDPKAASAVSPKGKVAARLGAAFGNPGLKNLRQNRCNIAPYRHRRATKDELSVRRSRRQSA